MAIINILSVSVYIACIYLIKIKRYELILPIAYTEVTLHTLFASYYVGIDSGFYYYIFVLVIVSLIVKQKSIKVHIFKSLFFMSAFFILEMLFHYFTPIYIIDGEILFSLRFINFIALLIFSIPFMYYFISKNLETEKLLYSYATKDQLTGLYNRRYIDSIVDYEYSKRDFNSLVLVLADIDFFKKVNDNYGHHCGDKVLIEVSKKLTECIRQEDKLSRWGGEEFLFFMPNSSVEDAKILIERVRKNIDELVFKCSGRNDIKVTLTFGIAQKQINESFDKTLARADIALYDGKLSGRDCVVVSKP
jgi:diguanylate cyclase (GGDEF)-like protein